MPRFRHLERAMVTRDATAITMTAAPYTYAAKGNPVSLSHSPPGRASRPQAVLHLAQSRGKSMPAIRHANLPVEAFRGGATYQTVIGDPKGSTPIRLGIQTSPPGYKTPLHWHPYLESVTVLEGIGEAWIDGSEDQIALAPGVTLVFPANVRHQFRALGNEPLITLGVHASPHRIVVVDESGRGGLRE